MQLLLDANILSELLIPQPSSSVIDRLSYFDRSIAIASVTYYGMVFGYAKLAASHKKVAIEIFVRQEIQEKLLILPYDEDAAKWHALEVGRLRQIGKTPPHLDGQIAAIAAVNNLTLVTRNTKDFQHFENLKIENWFE